MRLHDLIAKEILTAGILILCSHSLGAQTLESSAAPNTTLAPSQQTSATPTLEMISSSLPSEDVNTAKSQGGSQISSGSELSEAQVIKDTSESGFGIQDVEDVVENLLSKKKITGALVGTTISAALSAHPLGAFLGGLVGAMVGKDSKYSQESDSSTAAGTEDLFLQLGETDSIAKAQESTSSEQDPMVEPIIIPPLATNLARQEQTTHDNCYTSTDAKQPRDRASLRHCFYYMY